MTTRTLALLLGCLPAPLAGCAGPQTSPVLVRDAETHAPIPGAGVRLSTPGSAGTADGTTGADGVARIALAAPDGAALLAQVTVSGYLPRDADLTGRAAHAPQEPAVVEVFAGPRPTVELVLPAGYQGVVRARVRVRDDAPAGGRAFVAIVPKSGAVEVTGPAVLTATPGPVFTARYEDGTRLSTEAPDAEVGLRWLWAEGPVEVFVVGTRADLVTAGKELGYAPVTGGRAGGGAPAGGRGGRGGGGGHRGGR